MNDKSFEWSDGAYQKFQAFNEEDGNIMLYTEECSNGEAISIPLGVAKDLALWLWKQE